MCIHKAISQSQIYIRYKSNKTLNREMYSQSQGDCSLWSYTRGEIIIRWVSDLLIGTGRSKDVIMLRQEMGRRNKQDKHKMS